MGAFLDIEGAFNNVLPSANISSISDVGIARKVVALIHQLITDRTVVAVWGISTKEKEMNGGTPQGGVLSPLVWLIVINDLLNNLD